MESIFAHYFGALSFAGATAVGMNGDELEGGDVGQGFSNLAGAIPGFNNALIQSELAFNHNLVQFEQGIGSALLGDNSAGSDVFNHAFNSFNMLFDTQQHLLNGFIGATGYNVPDYAGFEKLLDQAHDIDYKPTLTDLIDGKTITSDDDTDLLVIPKGTIELTHYGDSVGTPQGLTSSLLLGENPNGEIGGLQGMFGQSLAMWASLGDLFKGEDGLDGLFAGDIGDLGPAFSGFFTGLEDVFTPFTDFFEGLIPA